ncbi:hypothetical protein GIB67_021211 [Kingdonia uniflora]|uniref:SAC domain-containing protein n=1 Tax=Kingdonia uniflora TaxID=39325 RepID=A0A7J7LFH7_9MAGN|nr:hypothetical protein GIB67_021211 [Kingdonia uniflora]
MYLMERLEVFLTKQCVWNEFLTREIRNHLRNTLWTVALVYGFFKHAKLTVSGRDFRLTLIARRSRHYAGTRMPSSAKLCCTESWFNSSLLVPGDFPAEYLTYITKKDQDYEATRLHFQNLAKRYGSSIIILNLIKTRERKPRESILRAEFANVIEFINKDLSDDFRLRCTPTMTRRQLFTKMQSNLVYFNEDTSKSSNFVDLVWLSSSRNSCKEESYERSALLNSPVVGTSIKNVVNGIMVEIASTPSEDGSSIMKKDRQKQKCHTKGNKILKVSVNFLRALCTGCHKYGHYAHSCPTKSSNINHKAMNIKVTWDDENDEFDVNNDHPQEYENDLYSQLISELEKLKKEKNALIVKLDMCEKEKHTAEGKLKLTKTELEKLKLDLTFTKQKLEVFLHGAKNIDKMLSMSKNGTDKRGFGFDEQNAKYTSQITKFVKATPAPSFPKQSVTNAPHRHTKQPFVFYIFYCEACGRKGHLAPYCKYVPQFRGRNNLYLERGKPHRSYAQSFANSFFVQKSFNGFNNMTQTTEERMKVRGGTKRPRLGGTGILDGQRAGDNPVHWATEKGFKYRPIVKEQVVDIKSVYEVNEGYARVFAKFKARNWTKILTPSGKPVATSEGEFEEDGVPILPDLHIMVVDITAQHSLYTGSGIISQKMLDDESRLVHNIAIANIIPRSQKNEFSERMKIFLYAFKNDIEIDLPNIIIEEMIDVSPKMATRSSLPFARLVMAILTVASYKVFPDEPVDTKTEKLDTCNCHKSGSHLPHVLPSEPVPPGEHIGSSRSAAQPQEVFSSEYWEHALDGDDQVG